MLNLSRREMEKMIAEAIDEIPERFLSRINNVVFLLRDEPTAEQKEEAEIGDGEDLFGYYEGWDQSKKIDQGIILPDRIYIFRNPILRSAKNFSEAKREIRQTIRHEIAHHFGSDEDGAEKSELSG